MQTLIINQQDQIEVSKELERLIKNVTDQVAHKFNLDPHLELSVALVDDDVIQDLNLVYRQIDAPTDVLSFALNEAGEESDAEPASEVEENMIGDIIISMPRALAQSVAYGHSLERETGFLLCHGLLHILGYDHTDSVAAAAIFELQEEILASVNLVRK